MIERDQRFRPNAPDVASKIIDGEAILINLGNGLYYTLDEVGGAVWSQIERGANLQEIADFVVSAYDAPLERAQEDAERILAELLAEQLVVEAEAREADTQPSSSSGDERQPYTAPTLSKFDDMAEVFALDPPLPTLPNVGADPGSE